jgi:hypothetical protein
MNPRFAATILVVLALGGCVHGTFVPPPDSAPPATVLEAYLGALVAGDCSAGKVLGVETFGRGSGELCGAATVTKYRIAGPPATPSDAEVVFATTLTTGGSADGSVPAGDITWFYDLKRQPSGAWRLAGGGSGP